MSRKLHCFASLCFLLLSTWSLAQDEPFPAGTEGAVYYCPRIDLLPADQGGPQEIELDGELDEDAWSRAAWHGWVHDLSATRRGDGNVPASEDLELEWAAVADDEWLYVAWRIVDDVKVTGEVSQCDVWGDDSAELYIDTSNDGPECFGGNVHCYGRDDAQITIGLENENNGGDPDALVFGGLAGGSNCDFRGAHPELVRGVVREILDAGEYAGWQAEIALALETTGNNGDGTPGWLVEPEHGTVVGWNLHAQDDDNGGNRDHKIVWSENETTESAYRNPGAFSTLVFVDLSVEVPDGSGPVEDVTCVRRPDGTVTVTWTNPQNANTKRDIRILVNGTEVSSVPGSSEDVLLSVDDVPIEQQDQTIEVVNSSGTPGTCVIEPTQEIFVRGDSDLNGRIELTDGVADLNFLFLGGRTPRCMDSADADDDGVLGISDAILKFLYLFLGGSPPVEPSPSAARYVAEDCGPDPTTDDRLNCAVRAAVCP